MILREYQTKAVDAVRSSLAAGCKRPHLVLPTGAGKSIIFGDIVAKVPLDEPSQREALLFIFVGLLVENKLEAALGIVDDHLADLGAVNPALVDGSKNQWQ